MKKRIIKLDETSAVGNHYTTEVMQKALDALAGKQLLGTLCIGEISTIIDLADVSHVVDNLAIEDGYLVGEITILDTPRGSALKALREDAYRFAPCGTGIRDEDGKIRDFTLTSISATLQGY